MIVRRRSVPVEDLWVDGPGGPVHALVARPEGATGPAPAVVSLHGGPHAADEDRFSAVRALWVDAGFTVVEINYRGSTGYGSAWRDAIEGRPGLTELEDVAAVVDACVAEGIVDPERTVVEGWSWGGYLALLAAGRSPRGGQGCWPAFPSPTTSPPTPTRWSSCARSTGRCSAAPPSSGPRCTASRRR